MFLMPRFGVYYVPPADTDLYQFGTSIQNFDSRAIQGHTGDNPIRAQLPEFDESYVNRPPHHGLHMTLFGQPQCRKGDLPSIAYELHEILCCFAPQTQFTLSAKEEFVSYWGKNQQIVVLQYHANNALLMLHTLMIAKLSTYVSDSHHGRRLRGNPNTFSSQQAYRVKHFHSPFVLDGFNPHFTILKAYTGNQHAAMRPALETLFADARQLTMESICLMVQDDGTNFWRIHTEFACHAYPKAF